MLVPRRALYHVVSAVIEACGRQAALPLPCSSPTPPRRQRRKPVGAGLGRTVTVAVSPYRWRDKIEAAGAALAQTRPDAVVMDCIGYTRAMRRLVARLTNAPVILANAAVATVAREVIGEADNAHGA
jgi:protein AroM